MSRFVAATLAIAFAVSYTATPAGAADSAAATRWKAMLAKEPVATCFSLLPGMGNWTLPRLTLLEVPAAQYVPYSLMESTKPLATTLWDNPQSDSGLSAETEAPGVAGFSLETPEDTTRGFVITNSTASLALAAGSGVPFRPLTALAKPSMFPKAERRRGCGLVEFGISAPNAVRHDRQALIFIFRGARLVAASETEGTM